LYRKNFVVFKKGDLNMKTSKRTAIAAPILAFIFTDLFLAGLSLTACKDPSDDGGDTNQTPTAADYTIGKLTQTAGSVTGVTITPKPGKSKGAVTIYYEGTDGTTYAKNTALPTAAGKYAVTFDVAAAVGWNAASGLYAGKLTVNTGNPVAGDYDIGNLTQTVGNVTAVTVRPKSGKSTGAVTVYYNGSTTLPTVAGTYAVTFDVAAASGFNAVKGLSAGTLTVNKATGTTVNAPTLAAITRNSITINAVSVTATGQTVEYGINTTDTAPSTGWQAELIFSGLNANTAYYIFARSAANDNYNTGAASGSLAVITLQAVSENRIEYYWVDQHDNLVTTSGGATTIAPSSNLIITAQGEDYVVKQWYLDGLDTGQSGITYNFSSITTGKHIVSVIVEKNGKPYNTNITITVQ
jgi:hypothetical protein